MSWKVFATEPHEAVNQLEVSLAASYSQIREELVPPFSLRIPSQSEYLILNQALLYALLTQSDSSRIHLTHLHAIVTDGYQLFVNLLLNISTFSFDKLVDASKPQFLWITSQLVGVSAVGIQGVLLSLLRQIRGGDFTRSNLWLCFELLKLLQHSWEWVSSESEVLTSGLFVYLRLLSDHYHLSGATLGPLKTMEISFCIRALRECFAFCLNIGRDLIRLLQDLAYIPEFAEVWKDLLNFPAKFGVPGFDNILQIYRTMTPSRFFILRILPEMEVYLRFLLSQVKWGSQKRYQDWFAIKFLSRPARETIISDIVRFICCAHHPPNEILQSNIIARWAVVGWLLKCCRKNNVEANVKLALFYDWLFFDGKDDNIMNLEPGILLIVNSVPKYMDITQKLLEFLFLLVDNYDLERKDVIKAGVSMSFDVLTQKGVVSSFDPLVSCNSLSPLLRKRLLKFLPHARSFVARKLSSLPNLTNMEDRRCQLLGCQSSMKDGQSYGVLESSIPKTPIFEKMIHDLKKDIEQSMGAALCTLENLLSFFSGINSPELDLRGGNDCLLSPEALACCVTDLFGLKQHDVFSNKLPLNEEIQSATALIIRCYIFSRNDKIRSMLLFWANRGYPVGAHLLSYAVRLSEEARKLFCLENSVNYQKLNKKIRCDRQLNLNNENGQNSFVKCHFDAYLSYIVRSKSYEGDLAEDSVQASTMDTKMLDKLVTDTFHVYMRYVEYFCSQNPLSDDCSVEEVLSKLVVSDVKICCEQDSKRSKLIFQSVFHHLPKVSMCNGCLILLLVNVLDNSEIVSMQCELGLRHCSLFGDDTEVISSLVNDTLKWTFLEQQKFWNLLVSELVVSRVEINKLAVDFCNRFIEWKANYVALNGLLTLMRCCPPTVELVDAVLCLPDGFHDFSASILVSWVTLDFTTLFHSLALWLEKFPSKLLCTRINYSAISVLLQYLQTEELTNKNRGLLQLKANLYSILAVFCSDTNKQE